jgi:hypothetical protein
MKKLQVKVDSGWRYVFCRCNGRIITLNDSEKSKALPSFAFRGESDLAWFTNEFGNNEFRLGENK